MGQKKWNGKKTICRSITFFNDYIPIRARTRDDTELCAFGIVDGVKVGDAFVHDDTKNSIIDQIWKDQKLFSGSLEGKYNAQRVYIVRWEEEEVERAFWEGDALPFFFFCRVQCDGDKCAFMQDRRRWEDSRNGNEIEIKTYLTYDNTDMFIVVRAAKYSKGAEEINRLHQEAGFVLQRNRQCILKNSFTVMAVRYSWINKVTTSEILKWNQDIIESVYIRFIERKGGSIGQVEKKIKSDIPGINCQRWPILGTDDEMILLSNVGWGDFLSLYNEKTGLFGNRYESGSIYNQNAAGVTTQICVSVETTEKNKLFYVNNNNDSDIDKEIRIFNSKTASLKDKLKKINDGSHDINELNIILNALPKYSGEMFNDYVFFPLLKVLDTLFDLMIRQRECSSRGLDKAPFYDFLTGFCFYTQHTMLTDRHTAQIMGFNAKIYDIPVKLNALYNALLYRLTSILNHNYLKNGQSKVIYDFIALPGLADFVNVVELYKEVSDKKRLIKVEIPESSFYDVRGMITILSHEAAHYVGREMRSRSTRTEVVILSYAHVYVQYIENIQSLTGYKRELWEENKARMINLLYKFIYRRIKDSEQKLQIRDKDDIDYFVKLIPQIRYATIDIIEKELSTVFAPIIWEEKEETEKQKLLDKMQAASWKFVVVSGLTEFTEVSSQNILGALMKLYEESFADLMSILILQMDVDEYVSGIINCAESQGMDIRTLEKTEVCLRISAVLGCILGFRTLADTEYLEEQLLPANPVCDKWRQKLSKLETVNYEKMPNWQKIVQRALWLWNSKMHSNYPQKKYDANVYSALIYDDVVLEYATGYLKLCMRKFVENNADKDFVKKVTRIRELFKEFGGDTETKNRKSESSSGEDQIITMIKFIEDYRRDLLLK